MIYRILSIVGKCIGKPPGYERLVRLLCPPERLRVRPSEMIALRDEPVIVADPRTPLGWNLLLFADYEPELRICFKKLLRRGFVAVDVGANVGWHTLLMAQLVGDQGRVIAFEPNPSVRERLQFHISLNRFRQVEVLPYALANQAGCVRFNAPPVDDPTCGDGCLLPEPAAQTAHGIDVESLPFDSLRERLHLERLDLIKIDVEGFEWPALCGCEQAIATFRPHIAFEFDLAYIARCGGSREQLWEFFQRHRYELFVASRWGLEAARSAIWPNAANLWAVPRP
jgi:FkbM family methyltransferase